MGRLLDVAQVWEILDEVKDPEIPVVSVVELGIIREVRVEGGKVQVAMAPTFSGCPALQSMRDEIENRLKEAGVEAAEVVVQNRVWSSDRITPGGRAKLLAFGLAPPPRHGGDVERSLAEPVACPRCGSMNTDLKNPFGPTLCRAIYVCNDCGNPFEQFKPL
jgi:ring-1,2-phenylacetyl-CoA epoxidase subunit PaaD